MSKYMDDCLSRDRMWGIVTKYNKERGYGFIRSKVDGRSYCDHEDRSDDMGKLGVDHPPKTSPVWCPLRDK